MGMPTPSRHMVELREGGSMSDTIRASHFYSFMSKILDNLSDGGTNV